MTLTIALIVTFMLGIMGFFLLYIYGMRGVDTYQEFVERHRRAMEKGS